MKSTADPTSRGTSLDATPPRRGRREANKADKLRRISAAARQLFVEQGFDGTTMRNISAQAGVGFGTLFDYATNKRDLLFLVFNPALEEVLDESLKAAAAEDHVLDRLMALFGGYYALYSREKTIARLVLRELNFFNEGSEAQKFVAHRARFLASVREQVRTGIADGQLRAADPDLVTRTIFALFAWEVRRWLAHETPSVARGLSDLRALLTLLVDGLAPVT